MNPMLSKMAAVAVSVAGFIGSVHAYSFVAADYVRGQEQVLEFMGYLNAERQSRGLSKLELRQELCVAARLHAEDMLIRGYLSHQTQGSGLEPWDRAMNAGWPNNNVGENAGEGQLDAYEAFVGWMESDSHRAFMLSEGTQGVTFAGVGFAWEMKSDGFFAESRWVLLLGQGTANTGTPGIPSNTVGIPADDSLIGGTWYGFETRSGSDRPDDGSVLPLRRISVKLEEGRRIRRSADFNPLVKMDKRAMRLHITKGRLPKGVRLNKKSGRVRGVARENGVSRIYLLNRVEIKASGVTLSEPVKVTFRVSK